MQETASNSPKPVESILEPVNSNKDASINGDGEIETIATSAGYNHMKHLNMTDHSFTTDPAKPTNWICEHGNIITDTGCNHMNYHKTTTNFSKPIQSNVDSLDIVTDACCNHVKRKDLNDHKATTNLTKPAQLNCEPSDIVTDAGCDNVKRMDLNDHKAGMQGIDKNKINRIIHDVSKGSKFYDNEKRKEQRTQEKIAAMKQELESYSISDRQNAMREADTIVSVITAKRIDLSRTLVHIDMDAFYAAVEMRDAPHLATVPMAVGSNAMLSTSNYLARRFGVRAAMPGFIAKKLCPSLIIVPSHFDKYREVSKIVRSVFQEYDTNFLPVSLDEAYLDLTDYLDNNKERLEMKSSDTKLSVAEYVVDEIRGKIYKVTQLTASAGISPNMMLSKICSDMNKPNGQFYLKPNEYIIKDFVDNLPIRKVCGIGKVSEEILRAFDITLCKDLIDKREVIWLLFSPSSLRYFMGIALGRSENQIEHSERKSMGAETTFKDTSNQEELFKTCQALSDSLEKDLQKENLEGYNVTLKIKLASFQQKTRSKTTNYPIKSSYQIYNLAKDLLIKAISPEIKLRLMGIRISGFVPKGKTSQGSSILNYFNKFNTEESSINDVIIIDESWCDEMEAKIDACQTKDTAHPHPRVICPICQHSIQGGDDLMVNRHVDECLTKQTINEMMQEKSRASTFISNQRKRKADTNNSKCPKKKTLPSFWNKKM